VPRTPFRCRPSASQPPARTFVAVRGNWRFIVGAKLRSGPGGGRRMAPCRHLVKRMFGQPFYPHPALSLPACSHVSAVTEGTEPAQATVSVQAWKKKRRTVTGKGADTDHHVAAGLTPYVNALSQAFGKKNENLPESH